MAEPNYKKRIVVLQQNTNKYGFQIMLTMLLPAYCKTENKTSHIQLMRLSIKNMQMV